MGDRDRQSPPTEAGEAARKERDWFGSILGLGIAAGVFWYGPSYLTGESNACKAIMVDFPFKGSIQLATLAANHPHMTMGEAQLPCTLLFWEDKFSQRFSFLLG
jgi:hypothetical protein